MTETPRGSVCEATDRSELTVPASSGLGCAKIAVPKSETKAAGASFVLRHEQDAGDFDFVWCIGHSCPSP